MINQIDYAIEEVMKEITKLLGYEPPIQPRQLIKFANNTRREIEQRIVEYMINDNCTEENPITVAELSHILKIDRIKLHDVLTGDYHLSPRRTEAVMSTVAGKRRWNGYYINPEKAQEYMYVMNLLKEKLKTNTGG